MTTYYCEETEEDCEIDDYQLVIGDDVTYVTFNPEEDDAEELFNKYMKYNPDGMEMTLQHNSGAHADEFPVFTWDLNGVTEE